MTISSPMTLVLEITWDERMALMVALTLAVRHEQREMELLYGPLHEFQESNLRCVLGRARQWLEIACGLEMTPLQPEILKLIEACEART